MRASIEGGGGLPHSVPYLDSRSYACGMDVVAHIPTAQGNYLNSVGGIMAIGDRRYLMPNGRSTRVVDISDPTHPVVVNENGAGGQVAYHRESGRWLLLESVEVPTIASGARTKYDDPDSVARFRADSSFRGIRIWDVSDPTDFRLVSEYDTGRSGSGSHDDAAFWDGGKYAYLSVAPDDSFVGNLGAGVLLSHCLMILDLSDPTDIKEVATWWVPGQRGDELSELKRWNIVAGRGAALPDHDVALEEAVTAFGAMPGFGSHARMPYTNLQGPVYVPRRVDAGGTLGFGAWSGLGFLIHDLSDISRPRLVGRFDPAPMYGAEGMAMRSIWLGGLSRGFVVTVSEAINPHGQESWLPCWVVDVRDPSRPIPIAQLPRPQAPPEAPYDDLTLARGRFGMNTPARLLAPGRMRNDFLPIAGFNAGIRCYDLSVPSRPEEACYFVPGRSGDDTDPRAFLRPAEAVSVEWDRNLLYAGTSSGIYVLSCRPLGAPILKPMPVSEWSLPGTGPDL